VEESESIKDFMKRTGSSLVVKRIPGKALDLFKKTANEEFEGDYGLTIKHILEQSIEYQLMKKKLFKLIDLLEKKG